MRLMAFAGLALPIALLLAPAGVAAAGACQLSSTVDPGHTIALTGSGFGANAVVDITQTWSGSTAIAGGARGPRTSHLTARTDAGGAFTTTIDAGPGHGGTYDFSAAAAGCTAVTTAEAVETAGGVRPGGAGVTPPPTDTATNPPTHGTGGVPLVPLALISAAGGLIIARRRQRA